MTIHNRGGNNERVIQQGFCYGNSAVCAGAADLASRGVVEEMRKQGREEVSGQRTSDRERVDRVRKEMRAFMDEINGRLGTDEKNRFRDPIDPDSIDDIDTIDHFHSKKKITPREYAFASGERVPMRSEGGEKGRQIGSLDFREKVEVLAQSDRADAIRGVSAPWVLVRRAGGDEGWVFGAFLSAIVPERKTDLDMPDKKETGRRFNAPVDGSDIEQVRLPGGPDD